MTHAMQRRRCIGLMGLAFLLGSTQVAWAGMAAPTLEDIPRLLTLSNVAKLRLDAISFFVVCLLGVAWAIRGVWNSLAKDFPSLPRISYLRSLGSQSVPNGAAPNLKQASHSWQTRILPYMSVQAADIDFIRDWDDPKNAPAFRRFVRHYLNPDIGELRESRGYAVSHFAGNSRLFSRPHPLPREALGQGSSNTVLCGEVAANFMAWGDPANLRDPMAGVNRTPGGFGGTDERGAFFLMADGSVRSLSTDTDQHALAALAIPMPPASDNAH